MEKSLRIDDMDRKILRVFQASPELGVADLASAVGLSQTPCWRRLRRMEDAGIILGRANVLNAEALGFAVNVIANVRIGVHDADTLEAFDAAVREIPQIVECFSMSGESDYLLRVMVESIAEYERFLRKTLLQLPGVVSVNSSFTLSTVKITSNVPI